ncbi:uncharacterized protein IL334_005037 [Kwoniella shivajii]|uniref:Dehydrin n=1 Tax=Kwoniella shivajii TaxID=564305 RepID=A0ABZ1D220_9TREE|nr:hypothetical protein IL334_005037 [Kwoniella shivajii]
MSHNEQQAAKPSIGQKIGGGIEELVGKVTSNPGKVAEGEAKKNGFAGPPGGAQGYNHTLHEGQNPGGPVGEHAVDAKHSHAGQHGAGAATGTGIAGEHDHDHKSHTGPRSHTGEGGILSNNNSNAPHSNVGHNEHQHQQHGINNQQTPFPSSTAQGAGLGNHSQQGHAYDGVGRPFQGQHSGLGGGEISSSTRNHESTGLGSSHGQHGEGFGAPGASGLTGNHNHNNALTGDHNHGGIGGTGIGHNHGTSGIAGHNQGLPLGQEKFGGGGPEGIIGGQGHNGQQGISGGHHDGLTGGQGHQGITGQGHQGIAGQGRDEFTSGQGHQGLTGEHRQGLTGDHREGLTGGQGQGHHLGQGQNQSHLPGSGLGGNQSGLEGERRY